MSVAYFDTSALVKGYIAELGSDWTRTLLENQDPNVFTSLMTVIEAACTFARRQREGLLSSDDHHQLLIVLDYDFAYRYNVLGVEPVVIDRASIQSTASSANAMPRAREQQLLPRGGLDVGRDFGRYSGRARKRLA